MAQHTEGPWEISTDGAGADICVIYGGPRRPTDDGKGQGWVYVTGARRILDESEQEANANLISAAPDLLEALEDAIDRLEMFIASCGQWADGGDHDAVSNGHAAIAKARGLSAKQEAA